MSDGATANTNGSRNDPKAAVVEEEKAVGRESDALLEQEEDGEGDDGEEELKMRDYIRPLLPQMVIGFVDAVSFMVVAPSLVFYVLKVGGSKESYGIILASFSFSSFLFKPVLAYWSDSIRQFKLPYMVSTIVSGLGGLVYFLAGCFPLTPTAAIALIWTGRLLGGCGAANMTLGYTYVAHIIPSKLFTPANALLSMMRVTGMALAPVLNAGVAWIHAEIKLGPHWTVTIDPLNSVGLLLALGNLIGFLALHFLFEEPSDMAKTSADLNSALEKHSGWAFWAQLLRPDIGVPLLSIIVLNANYQLLETGLAPAAHDVLGWEPVRISALFGANAMVIFAIIVLTYNLASRGCPDMTLMKVGLCLSVAGYTSMYLFWRRGATVLMFVLPVLVSTCVFPFLSSPTRSLFTKAVMAHPHLRHHQGTMQAVMSMAISVAGFAAPGLIATYVLRTPEQAHESLHGREFTPYALFAPLLSALTLAGVLYVESNQHKYRPQDSFEEAEADGSTAVALAPTKTSTLDEDGGSSSELFASEDLEERLSLLASRGGKTPGGKPRVFVDPRTVEAARRHTVMLMGVPDISIHGPTGFPLYASSFPHGQLHRRRRSTSDGRAGRAAGWGRMAGGEGGEGSWRHTLAW